MFWEQHVHGCLEGILGNPRYKVESTGLANPQTNPTVVIDREVDGAWGMCLEAQFHSGWTEMCHCCGNPMGLWKKIGKFCLKRLKF